MEFRQSKLLELRKRLIDYQNSNSTLIISKITEICGAIPILWDPTKREYFVASDRRTRYFRHYIFLILQTWFFGLHLFGRKFFHTESSNDTNVTAEESFLYMFLAMSSHFVASSFYFVSDPQSFCLIQNSTVTEFNNIIGKKR